MSSSAVEQIDDAAISAFVGDILRQEDATPTQGLVMRLLDQCLGEIFRETKAFDTSWTNPASPGSGDLNLDGTNATDLPIDCQIIESVEWDGSDNPLDRKSLAELDYLDPGWRDNTGETPGRYAVTGRRLFLDITPSDATGKLVIRGYGVPPRNVALTYFPADIQLAPATYILMEWPWDPAIPRERARHEQYTDKWWGTRQRPGDRGRMIAALRDRNMEPFTFDA